MPYNPTGNELPSLVYDEKTRVGGEFFLYYNLGLANVLGTLGLDGNSSPVWQPAQSCGQSGENPSGGFTVAKAKKPLISTTDSTWRVNALTGGILPGSSPIGQACELGAAVTSVTSYTISGASAGDGVDIIVLPNPDDDVLICFDQGLSANIGAENRPVPRKFDPVDHYVRQRPENTISLKEIYCCNLRGLSLLRQRDVTLIGKWYPDGGAIPSEIVYFTGVRLNIPMDIPEDSNESATISAEGMFRDKLAFTARPA